MFRTGVDGLDLMGKSKRLKEMDGIGNPQVLEMEVLQPPSVENVNSKMLNNEVSTSSMSFGDGRTRQSDTLFHITRENQLKWVEKIAEKLKELGEVQHSGAEIPRFRIFRVSKTVKNVNRMHFQPELIFLGLFNKRFDPEIINLKGEKFKLSVVSAFLNVHKELEDGLGWEQICELIVDDAEGLQQLYYDKEEPRHREEATVRCELTLDAIFLASFLSGYLFEADEVREAQMDNSLRDKARYLRLGSTVLNEGLSNHDTIVNDILKLENQIPLQLIRNVLGLLYRRDDTQANTMLNRLCRRWIESIAITLPGFSEKHFQKAFVSPEFDFGKESGHLLDCVCRAMRGDARPVRVNLLWEAPLSGKDSTFGYMKRCLMWLVHCPGFLNLKIGRWYLNKSLRKNFDKREKISIPSLTTLRDAGITVKGDASKDISLNNKFYFVQD